LSNLPDRLQDKLRAELDHLTTLADSDGMKGAEEVCAGQRINLDGLQGNEDVLLMLAVDHPQIIDRVSAQTSLIRHTGGRNWAGFQFEEDGRSWELGDESARDAFLQDAVKIMNLPEHRRREADWYQSVRVHPVTGEEIAITQATTYVEERAASELAFVSGATVERQVVPKVLEVGLACDLQNRIIEICARGGKRVRDRYAAAFTRCFAPHAPPPVEVPRREVLPDTLCRTPTFEIDPADGIERVEVSSLEFFSTGGGTARFERRGEDETIYEFLSRRYGPHFPLAGAWLGDLRGHIADHARAPRWPACQDADCYVARAEHDHLAQHDRGGSALCACPLGTLGSDRAGAAGHRRDRGFLKCRQSSFCAGS
jgi:hypothetical protein